MSGGDGAAQAAKAASRTGTRMEPPRFDTNIVLDADAAGNPPAARAEVDALAATIRVVVQTFLVQGRKGAPAEGRLKFNPLHFGLLGWLHDEGPTRPSELAGVLGVPRSTLSSVSDALSRKGLLAREADPADGRAHVLALSELGRETVEAMRRQDDRNAAAILEALTEEERAAFLPLITKIAAALVEG